VNASGVDTSAVCGSALDGFSDGASVSGWASASMAYAVESGLVMLRSLRESVTLALQADLLMCELSLAPTKPWRK
jgi:hypothetical protein